MDRARCLEPPPRGYTAEVLGAPLLGAAGIRDKFFYKHKVGYRTLKEVEICGNIEDADVLLNVSHFKGHGACGYGAASKNLAMGCVTGRTRGDLHRLEGGLEWDCGKVHQVQEMRRGVRPRRSPLGMTRKTASRSLYHHCAYCRHCVLACSKECVQNQRRRLRAVPAWLGPWPRARSCERSIRPAFCMSISSMQMTVYCDCWGFSSPSLIPDVGILAFARHRGRGQGQPRHDPRWHPRCPAASRPAGN